MDTHNPMELKQLEFARTVGTHKPDDKFFRIRIPRLMVNITKDKQRAYIDNTIFLNASECMVHPAHTISTQNYITIPRTPNCNLNHLVREVNDELIIPDNTPVVCACFYGTKCLSYIIDAYPLID